MEKTSGITVKDKIGYALGDVGMQFTFGLVASVLQKYYTDVLVLPIAWVMMLFILARIWDAVNDPMWGAIVDSRPGAAGGRYGRVMKYFSVPMGIATVLMFVKLPGLSTTGYFIYACITYVLFGMVYTCVNVPYGSMASVITTDDHERSGLSVFRSVGSAIGTVPGLVLIMLCYTQTDGVRTMSYQKIITGVIIISILGVIASFLCPCMAKERVIHQAKEKVSFKDTMLAVRKVLKSRPFWVLSVSAMLFLAASVFAQSYYTYLADKYFGMSSISLLAMVAQYLPVAVIMLFIGKWVKKFGRKEICAVGMAVAFIANLILFFLQTHNPWVFLAGCLIAGIGNAFMFLQIWALATEVVDYNEYVCGVKEEAISYSVFSFIRKLGHAVSAVFVNASLLRIGYSVNNLSEETLNGMYNSSVLIPAVLYALVALLLWFFYPLNKKEIVALQLKKTKA